MTTTPFDEIRRVEQIKAELRERDEFERAKAARGDELVRELTARAEAKTHDRYLAGGDPPAKLIGLTDAGKHALELEKRIAAALKIADAAEHDDDDGEHIAYILRMRNVLRGVDEWSI
jgi:hypothetical protein